MNEPQARGYWLLVYLQQPGQERTPAGVLVWDAEIDRLFFALRGLSEDEEQDGLADFWLSFSDFLQSISSDLGGRETLRLLEGSASHVVQVSIRTSIEISEPIGLVEALFVNNVAASPRVVVERADLELARERVSVLPSVAIQILAAINNPRVDLREMEKIISSDPVLTGQIIRVANSAGLPTREPVRSLGKAIQRIGVDATKLQVFALTVSKVYSSPRLRRIWKHSICASQVARELAPRAGLPADEAALLALVHDIGRIVIFNVSEKFDLEYSRLQSLGLSDVTVEAKMCTINHADLGANLLQSWGFPNDMCEAIRFHHTPSQTPSSLAAMLFLVESSLEENEDI